MKYRLKSQEVEAIKHPGPTSLTVVGKKGEQSAKAGDYIIIDGPAPQDREVVSEKDFHERYEPSNPIDKSSGIDGDPGDWTERGDGKDYPDAPALHIEERPDGSFVLLSSKQADPLGVFPTREDADAALAIAIA